MTRSVENFQPARFEEALSARSLSAVELAARIGVTSTTISRWRNRAQLPSGEMLEKLASELRVSAEWLTRAPTEPLSKPCFRGSAALMKGDRSLLGVRIKWLDDISKALEAFVDYPEVNVPRKAFHRLGEISEGDIEDAANECRRVWGLGDGPIADVTLLLENAGVILAREETGTPRIEGLSAWNTSGRPLIFLCADKGNAYRSRFDAAHELGHLVLHSYISAANDAASHKLMEQQAHRFAGAFLLPAQGFAPELSTPVSLQGLLFLKKRWGVSVAAMIMRARRLGFVDDADYLRLIKLRSAKWGNRQEPNDDDRVPEAPRLLQRTVDLLLKEGILTSASLPTTIGLSARDIEGLTGLPWGSLSREKAEVVELPTLKKATSETSGTVSSSGGTIISFPVRSQ